MQEKEVFINNSIYILNELDIENDNLQTKYEYKKFIRDIISSNNKNLYNSLQKIIELRYQLEDDKLVTLNEIFPNIDLFISTYMKVANIDITLSIDSFNYESLLYYLVKSYVSYMKDKQNEEAYLHMNKEEKKLIEEIEELENKLKKYQIVKKNRFYYETYLQSIEYENDIYTEDKEILNSNLNTITNEIRIKETELNKLESRKLTLNKKQKMLNYDTQINNLIDEKEKTLEELKNIEENRKEHLKNNNKSFKEYVKDINIDEYKLYYEELKDLDVKKLLKDIQQKKEKLNNIIEEISISNYPEIHLILKHYCLDNLKTLDLKCDLSPKILNDILKLLNDNKK